ncbi:GumC family protein [Haliea sp. E17]|uniref:GumC family protein n=1 Tax=Haliea sp. E17 TaxID=3401576 RepID=UPI003AABCD9B
MNQMSPVPPQTQAPLLQPAADDDFIDLGRLFRAVLRYKWGILGLAFAITLLTGLAVFSMQPVYRATASIELESAQANVVGVEDVYGLDTGNYNYTQTQYEILKSRSLAERVVRRLRLHEHPVFLPEDGEEEDGGFSLESLLPASKREPPPQLSAEEREEQAIQAVTSAVAGGLSVAPVQYSYIVYLSYESTDRKLAAAVVNAIAEEFIASNLENRLTGTLQATDWLDTRMADLKQKLEESESALQEFREREGLVSVEGRTSLGNSELAILSQRLEEARRQRIEAQAIREEVQGMGDASTDELLTIPAVLNHSLIADIKREQAGAERRVAELAKRYGPMHPKMIAGEAELEEANANLAREVRKVVSGISREYDLALRNERQLEQTWEASKSELQDFNRVEFRLQELQREVDTNRQLYDIFFTRIKSVSETGGFEKPHARILDRAMVPGWPVKPNKKMSVMLALILGLMLGCGIAILLDILDNTVKTPDDVVDRLGVPLLGTLPKLKTDRDGNFPQFWQKPQGQYAEAIRTIRTGVVLSGLDEPAKVILVTSTVPGEGKSTTALNLASALGQMEKTLVIGADLRRPSLAKRCDLPANHPGLSHFVSGTVDLKQCIKKVGAMQLFVMPAGIIPPNPLEMVSSRRFAEAIDFLRGQFERIVIDSAPVQAVSDALVLASYADSVVYVVKADSTPATAAQKAIASIVASNEPLTGVVLNQFDMRKASRYSYGGKYYQYQEYYQSKEEPA